MKGRIEYCKRSIGVSSKTIPKYSLALDSRRRCAARGAMGVKIERLAWGCRAGFLSHLPNHDWVGTACESVLDAGGTQHIGLAAQHYNRHWNLCLRVAVIVHDPKAKRLVGPIGGKSLLPQGNMGQVPLTASPSHSKQGCKAGTRIRGSVHLPQETVEFAISAEQCPVVTIRDALSKYSYELEQ